jgi:hypothetical protein
MPVTPQRFAVALGALLLTATSAAHAEGKPLHLSVVMEDADRKASVHEAVMVALTKAGFDPADDEGIDPAASDADLRALSAKHGNELVLLLTVEAAGKGFKLNAVAAAGAAAHSEESTARGKGLEPAAAELASRAAGAVSSSGGELLGGPTGRLGLEIGLSGLGVLALGYIPAVVLASKYGSEVPNAARSGVLPVFGVFTARTKLSDEILNDGASPGLLADGTIQLLGAAGLLTGAGMIVYAKVQQARAGSAANPDAPAAKEGEPPVSVLPVVGPGFAGAEVALRW